jgi:hypothetical protein
MPDVDLRRLSDAELIDHLRDVRLRIAVLEPQIQTRTDRIRGTIKVVRGTILVAGGILTMTADLFAFLLILLGAWDWTETIADDARETNRSMAVRRAMRQLVIDLDEVQAELGRRGLA